jgi:8-oxo-dGTP diphosphatase
MLFQRGVLNRRAAGALILNDRNELLMVRDRLRREWSYPGGYVGRSEAPLEACAREVHEETGLDLAPERYRLLDEHTWRRPLGRLTFTTFAARVDESEAMVVRRQRFELLEVRWAPRDEALDLITLRLKERFGHLLTAMDAST